MKIYKTFWAWPVAPLLMLICFLMLCPSFLAADSVPAELQGKDFRQTVHNQLTDEAIGQLLKLHLQEGVAVRVVQLPVVVHTKKGRIVDDLEIDDFNVYENNRPQDINYLRTETDGKISIAFLLDVSGSMRKNGYLAAAKLAIHEIVDELAATDPVSLIAFADEQVATLVEFTTDHDELLNAVDLQEGYGKTALFDAIYTTANLVFGNGEGKKVILLFSDGTDNHSQRSDLSPVTAARRTNMPIYSFGFSSAPQELYGAKESTPLLAVLERISRETGGELLMVGSAIEDIGEAVRRVIESLRFQYVIEYHVQHNPDADGEFRLTKVEMAKRYKNATVQVRSGYYTDDLEESDE